MHWPTANVTQVSKNGQPSEKCKRHAAHVVNVLERPNKTSAQPYAHKCTQILKRNKLSKIMETQIVIKCIGHYEEPTTNRRNIIHIEKNQQFYGYTTPYMT
jgi:hypothetical protein